MRLSRVWDKPVKENEHLQQHIKGIDKEKRACKCDFLEYGWAFAKKRDPERYVGAEYGPDTLQEQLWASSTSWDNAWYRVAIKGSSQKVTETFLWLNFQWASEWRESDSVIKRVRPSSGGSVNTQSLSRVKMMARVMLIETVMLATWSRNVNHSKILVKHTW